MTRRLGPLWLWAALGTLVGLVVGVYTALPASAAVPAPRSGWSWITAPTFGAQTASLQAQAGPNPANTNAYVAYRHSWCRATSGAVNETSSGPEVIGGAGQALDPRTIDCGAGNVLVQFAYMTTATLGLTLDATNTNLAAELPAPPATPSPTPTPTPSPTSPASTPTPSPAPTTTTTTSSGPSTVTLSGPVTIDGPVAATLDAPAQLDPSQFGVVVLGLGLSLLLGSASLVASMRRPS